MLLKPELMIPSDVEVCRVCFSTDCKLYSMSIHNDLNEAYKDLTGLSSAHEGESPGSLCGECARRATACAHFRARSLRAHALLLDIVSKHDRITLESIKSIVNGEMAPVGSNLRMTHNPPNQFDLDIQHNFIEEKPDLEEWLSVHRDVVDNIKVEADMFCDDSPSIDPPHDDQAMYLSTTDNSIVVKVEECTADEILDVHAGNSSSVGERDSLREEEQKAQRIARKVKKKRNTQNDFSRLIQYDELCCDVCPYKTNCEVRFLKHLDKHTGTEFLRCNICSYKTKNERLLKHHVLKHSGKEPFSCHVCEKSFGVRCNLIRHLRLHSGAKPYSCDVCSKTFNRIDHYKCHLRIHAQDKPFYTCDLCKKSFNRKCNLKLHLKLHSGDKPYKCQICKKAFSRKFNLQIHLGLHSGEKPYACGECKQSFRLKDHLRKHMKLHFCV